MPDGLTQQAYINGKVEGNVLGTYGQDSPISGKSRDFLGIKKEDLKTILSNFPVDDRLDSTLDVIAENIIKNLDTENLNKLKDDLLKKAAIAAAIATYSIDNLTDNTEDEE